MKNSVKGDEVAKEAAERFREGAVVVFPTDTVWGIGACLSLPQAISKMYRIKGRASDKPSQVLVADLKMAASLSEWEDRARRLAERYWPGALTIIVSANKGKVPEIVRGGGDTVGLRVPNHEMLVGVIRELGTGIVAASANLSGSEAPASLEMVDEGLLSEADFVLDFDPAEREKLNEGSGRKASTVVDVSGGKTEVLREGPIQIKEWA